MATIIRVSIMGAMPSGEVWSVNPVYRLGSGLGTTVSAAQCQTIATAIAARVVPTGLMNALSTSTTVTGCRVEAREMDGSLNAQAEAVKATPTAGNGGTTAHPYQTAIVASLRTSTVGARGRGRLYWPATGMLLTVATLRVSAANVSSILSGMKTYLSGISTDIDTTLGGNTLGVWSRASADTHAVTSIQMGDVLDVQRRRRDQLIESYSSVTYP